ncbi:MAG: class I SAM-dependent methyltransferase [Treponema sp.]|jgi:SAM-dependent methyltransferase|nr:class I SAM-dependent methyltransferase [Treponema sp.]
MRRDKEWFNDDDFWKQFAPIMFDRKHWEEAPEVADGVTRLARLKLYGEDGDGNTEKREAPRLLDLCCGFGRITAELARRGFNATGVDITAAYLETAEDDAAYEGLDIEYVLADARAYTRPAFFDTVVNLYISFGYFADPADDLLLARNAWESLKSGGAFIIETLGKEIAVRDFIEGEWFERAGCTVLTEYAALDSWGSLRNRWILLKGAERIEKTFTQRLYAATELRRLLLDAGFASVELYGGWDESPYDNRSETLIAVGRK